MLNDCPTICAIGDVHGHLQLALCVAARLQEQLNTRFDVVLVSGDVGTFTEEPQLDNATRRCAKNNPCELEFLYQWSVNPQPEWIQRIFMPIEAIGLGLQCPVIMVHGNHEGFSHLETLVPHGIPSEPVKIADLPGVDTGQHIRYLPSGWKCRTPSGFIVAGIGGIERNQRYASYHELAFLNEEAIIELLDGQQVDILLTHQGPYSLQGDYGSQSLQLLLDAEIARIWIHGHSVQNNSVIKSGPQGRTLVIPLGDIGFVAKGANAGDIGKDGWSIIWFTGEPVVIREHPTFWRDFRRSKWHILPDGQLICPALM